MSDFDLNYKRDHRIKIRRLASARDSREERIQWHEGEAETAETGNRG